MPLNFPLGSFISMSHLAAVSVCVPSATAITRAGVVQASDSRTSRAFGEVFGVGGSLGLGVAGGEVVRSEAMAGVPVDAMLGISVGAAVGGTVRWVVGAAVGAAVGATAVGSTTSTVVGGFAAESLA